MTDIAYADVGRILTKATGFMSRYDYTLNPYGGCAFGCTYCYAAFSARDQKKQPPRCSVPFRVRTARRMQLQMRRELPLLSLNQSPSST